MNPDQPNVYLEIFKSFLQLGLPPILTLLAGYIGVNYGIKQLKVQKRYDFIERQLNELYAPLLAYRKEIRAKSEVRVKVSKAADEAWKEKCKTEPKYFNHNEEIKPYIKHIEYDNQQFENELLPLYREMLSTFSKKYALAEPSTRGWYNELCEFIEVWERSIIETIPPDVIQILEHNESKINPFYENLEEEVERLRNKLMGK